MPLKLDFWIDDHVHRLTRKGGYLKIIPPTSPSSFGGFRLHLEAAVLAMLANRIVVGVHWEGAEFCLTGQNLSEL